MASFHGSLSLAKPAPPLWSSPVPLGSAVKDSLLGLQTHLLCEDTALDDEVWEVWDATLFILS